MANGTIEYAGEYELIKCDILINGTPQPVGPNVLAIKLFEIISKLVEPVYP